MKESYKGFSIEYEKEDAASLYDCCVVGIDGYVYHCGTRYESKYDAWLASVRWIDSYIKSIQPVGETCIRIQIQLKEIEEELQKLTDTPYENHYRLMSANKEMSIHLYNALENVTEALKTNEQVMKKLLKEG